MRPWRSIDKPLKGLCSINQAKGHTDKFKESTLQDRISGKVSLDSRSGSGRLLTDEEESCLADFLVSCATIGYAKLRKEVLAKSLTRATLV